MSYVIAITIGLVLSSTVAAFCLLDQQMVVIPLALVVWSAVLLLDLRKRMHALRHYKVLDSSALIDGRIIDICKSRFLEGTLLIPQFVIQELVRISESSDIIKCHRGKRGLDAVASLQKQTVIPVRIVSKPYSRYSGMDAKLMALTKTYRGALVTVDKNITKLAGLQSVPLLNVHTLSKAVKTAIVPGEWIRLRLIKEGKEEGQGVGYLNDGTMVVVENGQSLVDQEILVEVTTVLQTAAGPMVFAKYQNQG